MTSIEPGTVEPVRTDPIATAVADLAAGRPVVVLDAADRENEGDLIMAAADATAEWMALFTRYGSGYICAPLSAERADALDLPLMVARNEESLGTAFTITVDAREGVTTGISAADRAHTIRLLASPGSVGGDFVRPGHVLPLRAHPGGLAARAGHTEAALALTRLAGKGDVGVIVELVEDDGTMRRAPSCRAFADEHGLALIAIEDLQAYLVQPQPVSTSVGAGPVGGVTGPRAAQRVAATRLPTVHGEFEAVGYRDAAGVEHIALTVGDVAGRDEPVLVRVHSECLTGDVFGSRRCDCGPQLSAAMATIQAEGRGVIVYHCGHEGRGIGLVAKLAAYALQDGGRDTVEANLDLGLPVDARTYGTAADILADLGVRAVTLLTNNPAKTDGLRECGVTIVGRTPLVVGATADNIGYLDTKRRLLGHDLPENAALCGGGTR